MSLRSRLRPTEARQSVVSLYDTQRNNQPATITADFKSFADNGYSGNGIVYSLIQARMQLFSEVRFKWRNTSQESVTIQGREITPGELYWTDALRPIEAPWPNGTTGSLLARMILDVDLSGNSFLVRTDYGFRWLRPDWVGVITNRGVVTGYVYEQGGIGSGKGDEVFEVKNIVHWMPNPDPMTPHLGQSWLMPVAREVNLDKEMQSHKRAFFRNAATPNLILKFEGKLSPQLKDSLRNEVNTRYEGTNNAYATMLLEGGADIVSVGHSFKEQDFARIQDAGETRLASAAGVPPVLVGFNSGLQAATYSNYLHAMRRYADATLRPLWRTAADALGTVVKTRTGHPLAFDDRDVPALQQDAKDDAEILQMKAQTMSTLINAGYEADSVARVVMAGRLEALQHTGHIPTSLYQDASPDNQDGGPPSSNNAGQENNT